MAKSTGLGDNLYIDGFDVSNDIQALSGIAGGPTAIELTGIDKSAMERVGGLLAGSFNFTPFFNPSANRVHAVLSTLPTADRNLMYCQGTAIGNAGACVIGKQVDYDPKRSDKGELTFKVEAVSNGFSVEWGDQLSAGKTAIGAAGAQTGFDYGATVGTTAFGLQAYLQAFAFTGTSATVAIQHSNDNGGTDPWADVTGGVFTAVTSAPGAQRLATGTTSVKRWLRANVTGTFSAFTFAVVVMKNQTAVQF